MRLAHTHTNTQTQTPLVERTNERSNEDANASRNGMKRHRVEQHTRERMRQRTREWARQQHILTAFKATIARRRGDMCKYVRVCTNIKKETCGSVSLFINRLSWCDVPVVLDELRMPCSEQRMPSAEGHATKDDADNKCYFCCCCALANVGCGNSWAREAWYNGWFVWLLLAEKMRMKTETKRWQYKAADASDAGALRVVWVCGFGRLVSWYARAHVLVARDFCEATS